ncbi:serine/threonine-protein phosphatase 6 regulatory subunit 1 [Plutella xylostella]|uniref:serine/threonine-protein phosphatase 6 regulatory subunit 1 n=1 Tax=Plutella xylostella TaxID=51655 RepID=UPI0020325792|nr:serine/threonine-protein phosphatase 6 regulatory subunit 1 [Plutella xylostella]
MSAVASANAAALLCDIILTGCAVENSQPRPRTGSMLMQRLQSEALVRLLLQSVFTSDGGGARRHAVVNGCRVLAALLHSNQYMAEGGPGGEAERRAVELALAPHLPLLHQELLTHTQDSNHSSSGQAGDAPRVHVGAARVEVAALLAQLASSEVPEVPTTLLALGTAGVLLDLMFSHPHNNFLHAQVTAFVSAALVNCPYRTQYARHLILECDILTRLLDAYEENENKDPSTPRAGYMGHVILLIRRVARALEDGAFPRAELPTTLAERWSEALQRLEPLFQQLDTPLGGYYPSEYSYEDEMCLPDTIGASYDFNDMATSGGLDDIGGDMNADDSNEVLGGSGTADFMSDGLADDDHKFTMSQSSFLELANQAISSMWDEDQSEQTTDPLNADVAPWEGAAAGAGAAEEGWAQFSNDAFGNPVDPFANSSFGTQFDAQSATASDGFNSDKEQFWNYGWGGEGGSEQTATSEIEQSMQNLHLDSATHPAPLTNQQMEDSSVELANNLLTAMSSMTPEVIANIVNANMNLDIEDRQTDEPSHDTPKDAELDSANNKDESRDTTESNEGNVSER